MYIFVPSQNWSLFFDVMRLVRGFSSVDCLPDVGAVGSDKNPSGTHNPSLKITELNVLLWNIGMTSKRTTNSNQRLGSATDMDQIVSMLCFA